ncbi:hypothetical protein ACWD3I_08085 [Streptomyces sp. NPDC002817]|uniref:hypothetical protein n=1 Tax=Streptomyces sp. NPDC088357 TaxID=3154655 RepID=UPI003446DC0D
MGVRWLDWCASRRAPMLRQRALRAVSGLERTAFTRPENARGRRDREGDRERARHALVRLAVGDRPAADAARQVMQGSRFAVEYLLAEGRHGSVPSADGARKLLVFLEPDAPAEVRAYLCARAPYEELARSVVLNHGWLPADERQHPWFLVITGQWLRYVALDPEGLRLRPTCRAATDDDWEWMVEARYRYERVPGASVFANRVRPSLLIFDEMIAERERAAQRARPSRSGSGSGRGSGVRPSDPPSGRGGSGAARRRGGNWAERAEDAADAVSGGDEEQDDPGDSDR